MQRLPSPTFSLIAVLTWGAMLSIASHMYAHGIDAFNLTAIRYGIAAFAFLALLAIFEGKSKIRYEGKFRELATLGTIGFVGFNLLAFVGLAHSDPAHAAIMIAMMPLITAIVRWARDGIKPPTATLIAIAVALVGATLVVTKGQISSGWGYGEALVLGGVVGWVFYTLGAADYPTLSPLRYTTLTVVPGAIVILLATVVADLGGWQTLPTTGAIGDEWPGLLFVTVMAAIIAILAWNTGVRRLGAPNAALFINLVPITALVISIAEGYRPVAAEYIGTAIVIAALVGSNLAARRSARDRSLALAQQSTA
jgi:drug/metabolite transporter (DMT)-like permease